jgi:hypothetical protein
MDKKNKEFSNIEHKLKDIMEKGINVTLKKFGDEKAKFDKINNNV